MSKKDQKIKRLEAEVARLKSAVAELKVLNEIAISAGKAADIDEMLNLIVKKSIIAIEAEQGSIHLVTSSKEEPFKTIIRQDATSSLKHNYHIGANITGWVLLNKKPLIVENLLKDKRFNPTEEEKKDIHSILCVPIWSEGKIIGIMLLINKKNLIHFSQSDLTFLSIISVQAGQLIKNLQLQQVTFEKTNEAEKLQELNRIKTNFFTSISHEFRTPLTLILGPSKQLLALTSDEKVKEEADIIYKNAQKLNTLVNQILDLSCIEAGMMKLKTVKQNLIPVIKDIVLSFQPFAEVKNIFLQFIDSHEDIIMYLDKDKIEKIFSNILSNALKFTSIGGMICVKIDIIPPCNSSFNYKEEDCYVEISVADTGIGIPIEHINNIFDRYYQVQCSSSNDYVGTGIGLSLTKELVELHKGKISVESEKGKGAIFKVTLPLGKDHLLADEIFEIQEIKENEKMIKGFDESFTKSIEDNIAFNKILNKEKPSLLIIEDNPDVKTYIAKILVESYNIFEASDGEEGLKRSYEIIPDLIISDIMMPKVDGIQLCQSLKTDSRTSHIPIILLTAKTSSIDKIESLTSGADDYITKPFETQELKTRIKNLLEQRERIHEHFRTSGIFETEEKDITSMDQRFLQNVSEVINKNISDSGFSVEVLAENLAMSRSLLHKKLTALVGEPPVELIKRIRLFKAADLIKHKWGNISEIAFEVGFNNPSYFAECFQKQFGFTPSQYSCNSTSK